MSDPNQPVITFPTPSHPNFKHFLLYSTSYFLFGLLATCLDPLIPYLSIAQNTPESTYSQLFLYITLGYIVGAVVLNLSGQIFTTHRIIVVGVVLMGVFAVLFGGSGMLWKGLGLFGVAVGVSVEEVGINVGILGGFWGRDLGMWFQFVHGFYGIGAVIGPYITHVFKLHTLTALGIASIITGIFYFLLPTPQPTPSSSPSTPKKPLPELPKSSLYLLSTTFLLTVGAEVSYSALIPQFATSHNFTTKQAASFYNTIYWIAIAGFRIVVAVVGDRGRGRVTVEGVVKGLALVGVVGSVVGYLVVLGVDGEIGMLVMSFMYGLAISAIFPLLFLIPSYHNHQLPIKQASIFILWSCLGWGFITELLSKLMQWFSPNWLLYGLELIYLGIICLVIVNSKILEKFRQGLEDGAEGKLEAFIGRGVEGEGTEMERFK